MAKYIKSYSNYVLKTKHQSTNDGTIYERDITTIGGRDQFAKGQVPIYRSGNFVITTNNDYADYKKISDRDWHRNDEGEIWTINTLKNYEKDEKSSYDKKIVIKKDYYDLRDFAYYGSCAELMRTSVENILKHYPGELYIPYEVLYVKKNGDDSDVQYTKEAAKYAWGENGYECKKSGIKGYYTSHSKTPPGGLTIEEQEAIEQGKPYTRMFEYVTNSRGDALEKRSLSLIDNPFEINMHDTHIPDGADPLKYFAENGISNYVGYLRDIDESSDGCGVNDNWQIDKEHEYSLSIKDIIYDGIGEKVTINDVFSVVGKFCSENPSEQTCDTEFSVNVTSHEIIETTKEDVYCIEPGKYIGKFTLCFNKIDYGFKTTPGLQRDDEGNPKEMCCDGEINVLGSDYSGEVEDISSTRDKKECSYELKIYMFMGDDYKVKYLVDDVEVGGNIKVTYDNTEDDCADNSATVNTDLSGAFAEKNFRARIRPKSSIIEEYFNNLSSFEKVLLNRHSDTLYTAYFELIGENDYGFYTYIDGFTFPTTYGGYNLGSTNQAFTEYVNSLSKIGEYYDSMFTDNLWRSMTHESIKNFDWTYTRHYTPGEEEPFIEGGTRIQKIIRVYGREFDDIKTYIEAIDDSNTVTYDNINNLPDYFFTDKLEDYGWDVKLVYPLVLSEFVNNHTTTPIDINNMFPKKYDEEGNEISTADAEKLNYFYDSDAENKNRIDIRRVFNQDFSEIKVKPYSCSNITTIKRTNYSVTHPEVQVTKTEIEFNDPKLEEVCVEGGSNVTIKTSEETGEDVSKGYHNDCGELIRIYCNENEYSSADVNNEFLKRLILNSKDLWKHKGTVDGMEMLLSLFGLKSKKRILNDEKYFVTKQTEMDENDIPKNNFDVNVDKIEGCDDNMEFTINVEANSNNCLSLTSLGKEYYKKYSDKLYDLYDYDIKEYTLFTTGIIDEWDASKNMYNYDWINSTKLISYNNNDYEPYQGLPVYYKEEEKENGVKERRLFPHFNSYDYYDGNPYYQMNGGWMQKKPFMFDTKNNIVVEKDELDNKLFTETIKNIKSVGTLKELLSNHTLAEKKGDICQVDDLSGRYAIIDGYVYDILTENDSTDAFDFIYATIENNSLSVGNAFFSDYVIISNPYEPNGKQRIDLTDEYFNNTKIKVYILKENDQYTIDVHSKESSISTFTVFENGKYMEGDNYTNYFIINDVDYYNELSVFGWRQLRNDEYEYYRMNTISDYREGNNPHTGHMHYDNGHEYLTYFQSIFKYTYEKDLFDYRQYDENDIDKLEDIETVGFKNLIDDDKCVVNYDSFLREDSKCHYFGTMISLANREGITCFNKRFDSDLENESNYSVMDVTRKSLIYDYDENGDNMNPELRNLRYGNVYGFLGEKGTYNYSEMDRKVTDQIVNTKRMDIDFYIKNKNEYSKEWLEEVKYIDSVILPYLSQMIPSGVIWRVNYITRNSETWGSNATTDCYPQTNG